MRAYEIAKAAFVRWKGRTIEHLLPGVEAYLILFVSRFALQFLGFALLFALLFLLMFAIFTALIASAGQIVLVSIVVLTAILSIGLVCLMIGISVFITGITNGGLTGVIERVSHGGRYEFGDVIKTGWRSKWTLFRISLITLLVLFCLIFIPIILLTIPIVVLIAFHPMMTVLIIFYYFFSFMIILVSRIFIVPLMMLPYIVHWNEGRVGWGATKGGFSFAFRHPKEAFGLGLLYAVVLTISMMIPGVGMIVSILGPSYMATCLQLLYDEKRG